MLAACDADTTDVNWDDELPRIDKPMLFLVGMHDICGRFSLEGIGRLVPRLRETRLEVFEESGHDPFIDETAKFGAVVNGFLA